MNLSGLCAARIKEESEEADGDMEKFSGNLMLVYESPPVPVNRNQT